MRSGSRMESTIASAKSCPCAMAARGLRLAKGSLRLSAPSARRILANLAAGSSLADHAKGNGPRNTRGRLITTPLHYAASFSFTLLGHRGWLTGGVRGAAPMPLKGELGYVDLVPVAGCSTYRSIASMRARASTRPPSMPWANQVCWDELRHSNLALACFRGCYSHDNVRLVGTLEGDISCWHLQTLIPAVSMSAVGG